MKKFKKILMGFMCCLMCLGLCSVKTNAAEILVNSTYCETTIASSRLTFSSHARPYSSSMGTYKVESRGTYTTAFGDTSKDYSASGTSGAYITNKALPSGGTKWKSVRTYYYVNGNAIHVNTVS